MTDTTPEHDPSTPWIGMLLDGRYQIRELLGEGGMGAVYVAEHLSLRKQVALKVIRAEFAGNEEIAARFTREAMATAQLDHPNVASAIDYGTLPDGGAYLVTQLVRGRSLEHHRLAGPMAWRQACAIGLQIADALSAAHAIHIVHRDLKPDNIILEDRDDGSFLVKVLDFGIARVTATAALPASDLTRMGTVIGTPGYMAPEQAMGESVDFRVDLYALGVILWECITGRVLWDGPTVSDLFTAQLAGAAPTLAHEVPNLPPELSALVDLLLDRNPKRRPESARQVRDALRRMAHSTLVLPPQASPTQARKLVAQRWKKPAIATALGLVGILVIARLACGGGDGGGDDPSPTTDEEPTAAVASAGGGESSPVADTVPTPPALVPSPPGEAKTSAADEPPAADATELPKDLVAHVETLGKTSARKARKAATDAILGHEPESAVPLYARNIAWLDRASSCEAKRTMIRKIADAGDVRAVPALRMLSKTSRKGCGVFKNRDCMECLRESLARTIGQLTAE